MKLKSPDMEEEVSPRGYPNKPLNEITTFSTVYLNRMLFMSFLLTIQSSSCFAIDYHTWRETEEAAPSCFSKSEADEHHSKC